MDTNPDNSHTARPIDPRKNVVCISQTAIPGNDKRQLTLVRKLVDRGFTVVLAAHDGFKIYNLEEPKKAEIGKQLKKLGKDFRFEADGTLSVLGMPIHAGGHGHEEDAKAWIKLVQADYTAPQHTSDPQGGKRQAELCEQQGQRSLGRIAPNFEALEVRAGAAPSEATVKSIGRILPSLIRVKVVRKMRQYFGGHIEAMRLVKLDGRGGLRSDGLMASTRPGGVLERRFASVDGEAERRKNETRKGGTARAYSGQSHGATGRPAGPWSDASRRRYAPPPIWQQPAQSILRHRQGLNDHGTPRITQEMAAIDHGIRAGCAAQDLA